MSNFSLYLESFVNSNSWLEVDYSIDNLIVGTRQTLDYEEALIKNKAVFDKIFPHGLILYLSKDYDEKIKHSSIFFEVAARPYNKNSRVHGIYTEKEELIIAYIVPSL